MKRLINSAFKHPLISGSSIIVAGSMFTSLLNYLFNLGMGRLLSISDYGTFASLMSIFNIFSVFSLTIVTVFTKFTASFIGNKKEIFIKPLFIKGTIWISVFSFIICGFIIIFSPQISQFLNINRIILVNITSIALFFSFLSSVGVGVLQGALRFLSISVLNIFSSLVKLVLGLILVWFGFGVFGSIGAFFLASLLSYLFILVPLYKFIKREDHYGVHIPNLRKNLSVYAVPVFFSTLGMTAFTTMDMILIKHFFSSDVAGHYAALSLMGRSIFYVVAPVTTVFFPLIAQKKERKEKLFGTLCLSMFLIAVPSLILSITYFIFPEFIISVFFPADEYKVLAPLMGSFSIFILLYSLSFLLSNFYLSIGKIGVSLITTIGAVLEMVFIILFHQSINQIVAGLIVISFLLLFSLLLYYRNATKQA